jgi:hypothetical protein
MEDFGDYAPLNRTFADGNTNNNRDDLGDALSDPYSVAENYYTKLALRQWKICPSDVGKVFFSVTNIKRVQKQLKREIYDRSYGKFKLLEDQNVLDLLQSMIVVYGQYGKDIPSSVIRQVKLLNKQTVEYIAPDMITNLKQHYGYLNDIKNPINPLPLPLNVNNAGRLQIPSIAQLYGL